MSDAAHFRLLGAASATVFGSVTNKPPTSKTYVQGSYNILISTISRINAGL